MTIKQLNKLLSRTKSTFRVTDKDSAIQVRRLLDQVNSGKVKLVIYEGWLAYELSSIVLDISYRISPGVIQHLVEVERRHTCGKVIRCTKIDGIGLKILPGENLRDTTIRCLTDKLGFTKRPRLPKTVYRMEADITCDAQFPCKFKIVYRYYVRCKLPSRLYDPSGYHVRRHGKGHTAYFWWRPSNNPID